MNNKTARANVEPVRQRTQYSCMAASMAMCLRANDHNVTEDEVNAVMGARPMKGAAWEQALATAQHYGCRATLTMPATVEQLKAWTDQGVPIMIAWNPEGRPWSHASVVFDVDDDLNVYVADPNIPNPKETVRVVSENDFYGKWYEKFPDYLVRRPACAIEREVTAVGQQIMPRTGNDPTAFIAFQGRTASKAPSDAEQVKGTKFWVSKKPSKGPYRNQKPQFKIYNEDGGVVGGNPDRVKAIEQAKSMKVARMETTARARRKTKPESMKTKMRAPKDTKPKSRNEVQRQVQEQGGMSGAGKHHNRDRDVATGRSRKPKHKNRQMEASIERLTTAFLRMASSSFWKPMSGKLAGWKHVDEEILAWLTWEDTYNTVKDRNIPDLHDVADPELMADGIPELMESYSNAARDHAQWVRQGWWPKRVKVPNGGLHLMILFRPRSKGFEARFPKKDMRKALEMGEQAAEVIRGSKYPRWMKPVKTGAYSGNPDGKPIYDVKVDHGEHQPLSGGTDVMKRLQDRYRIEQGHAPRDGNPQLTNETATQKVAWDWKKDGIQPRDSRLIGTRPGAVLQQWGEHHSGAPFAIIPRDTRGMRGPQDKYQKVVIQNGVITHDFGSVPQLMRLGARSLSNTPARGGRAVNRLALRFATAQMEALR